MTAAPKPEFDTQAAVRPWERFDLDNWRHSGTVTATDAIPVCERLRPHYGGDGKWRCDTCGGPVQVAG